MLLRFSSILKADRFRRNVGSRNILSGALRAICFLTHRRHPFKPVEPPAHYVRLRTGAAYDNIQQTYAVATAGTSEKTKSSNTIRTRQSEAKAVRILRNLPLKPLSCIAFRASISCKGMSSVSPPSPLTGALTMTRARSPAPTLFLRAQAIPAQCLEASFYDC
jgi:hypothetical protein